MKIKEYFKNLLGDQKEIFKKYGLTFILIAVITLLMVFVGFEQKDIEQFYTAMILTNILVFVVEAIFEFKWYRIPMYIGTFVLSIIAKDIILGDPTQKQVLLIGGLYISAILIAIYKIIKDSKITVSQYMSRFFNNNVILGIGTIVLQFGVMFIVSIIKTLLFRDTDISLYAKAEILLLGLFIIPGEILCLLNVKKEPLKPVKVLICYIILPIVTIAELVIYIYLVKIIVLAEIPSNRIYPIIASLFVAAFPTWIMIQSLRDKNKYIKANSKIVPYSFIPLICMQIYAVGIRITEMGLTPERYLGVILIIFEAIAIALTIIKNQKYLHEILLVGIAFVLIIMCIPGTNVIDVSWRNQLNRIISIYTENTDFEGLSEDNKKQVVSAYNYLKYDNEGKKHIPEYIDTDKITKYKVTNYRTEEYENELDKIEEIDYNSISEEFSVDGFKKAKGITFSNYQIESIKLSDIDFSTFKIYKDSNANKDIEDNIVKFIEDSINKGELTSEIIELDKNTSFWISSFRMRYDKVTKEINSIYIDGYMLIK